MLMQVEQYQLNLFVMPRSLQIQVLKEYLQALIEQALIEQALIEQV